jgi:hypothetical protein
VHQPPAIFDVPVPPREIAGLSCPGIPLFSTKKNRQLLISFTVEHLQVLLENNRAFVFFIPGTEDKRDFFLGPSAWFR